MQFSKYLLILAYKVCHNTENWLVRVENGVFPVIIDCMVILEGIAVFVFKEDARNVA